MKNKIYIVLLILIFHIATCEETINYRPENSVNPHSLYRRSNRNIENVNPHSFFYNKHTKEEQVLNTEHYMQEHKILKQNKNFTCELHLNKLLQNQSKELNYKVYYGRLLNILLSNIYFNKGDDAFLEGYIGIEATSEEIDILRNFKKGNVSVEKIDNILSKIIMQPRLSFSQIMLNNFNFVLNHQYIIYLTIGFLIVIFIMWKLCQTTYAKVSFITMCLFSYSWYITHQDMLKEINIQHQTHKMIYNEIPLSCTPEKQSWYQKLSIYQFLFVYPSKNDCQNYVKAYLSPPLTEVSLAMSLSRTWSNFIFEPIAVYGIYLNKFMTAVTSDMNGTVATLVQIIIIIGHLIIPIIIIIFIFGKLTIFLPFTRISYETAPSTLPQRIEQVTKCNNSELSLNRKNKKRKNKIFIEVRCQSENEDGHTIRNKSNKTKVKQITKQCPRNTLEITTKSNYNESDTDTIVSVANDEQINTADDLAKRPVDFEANSISTENEENVKLQSQNYVQEKDLQQLKQT